MNRALWHKAIHDARLLLIGCCVMIFLFQWIYVAIIGTLSLSKFQQVIDLIGDEWGKMSPIPLDQLATTLGRVAMSYAELPVIVIAGVWAISRGSDAISGEIDRGTMEMVLSQPVRRIDLILSQACVGVSGALLISASAYAGTATGLSTLQLEPDYANPSIAIYLPSAVNLFSLTFFLGALSMLISSPDRFRWRTIGIMGGIFVVELILDIVGRMAKGFDWISWCTFFTAFNPAKFATMADGVGKTNLILGYNGFLIGTGLLFYLAAAWIFCRRDLPAPL